MTGHDHTAAASTRIGLRLLAAAVALTAGVIALIIAIQLVRGVLG